MSVVDEIKARLDILDVVGSYVSLQRAGRYYRALCPFHQERTPSFYVSPERQSWHCFGACNTGGDVFSFVMRKEGLDFAGALRLLAQRAGVDLPERREKEQDDRLRRLREANEAAALFYHRLLLESDEAAAARRYLEARGVNEWARREFLLGYSPRGRDVLRRHLLARGFSEQELLEAGLLVEGEGGTRDRFHDRLIFPIRDARGRVAGFGGRSLDDTPPKYLNTPQTHLFDKGGLLYALDRAQDAIRRQGEAVIVEGYMDALAAHQAGFANVVASMGTALTERQVRLLRRYSQRLVLALDADAAGAAAALRSQEVVEAALAQERETVPVLTWRGLVRYQEAAAVELRVAVLPEGKDPDQVIRQSPAEWQALIASAEPVLDYRFRRVAESVDRNDPRARSQAVRELLPLVAAIADPVVRAHYLQRLSRLALVREAELLSLLRRSRAGPEETTRGPEVTPDTTSVYKPEDWALSLLLRYPARRQDGLNLPEELFWRSEGREVLRAWKRCKDLGELRQALPEELHDYVEYLLSLWTRFDPMWDNDDGGNALWSLRQRLEQRQLQAEKMARTASLAAQEEKTPNKLKVLERAARVWRERPLRVAEREEELEPLDALLLEDLELGLKLHGRGKERPSEGGGPESS